jgi:hypothetical protein
LAQGQTKLANTRSTQIIEDRLNSPPTTHQKMQLFGLKPDAGFWFTLHPVHIHIARDHLVLTDQRRLEITEAESKVLFQLAEETCKELGKTLVFGDSKTWFLRADDWCDLQTASLDAACGHNIDIWIARGELEVAWRKLQNEIQMLWHQTEINESREVRGVPAINSVWLHSGSAQYIPMLPAIHIASTFSNALQEASNAHNADQGKSDVVRIVFDQLAEAAINSDWGVWLHAFNQLETTCFAPLLTSMNAGQIKQVSFIINDSKRLATFTLRPAAPWKFWRKPSLQTLLNSSLIDA